MERRAYRWYERTLLPLCLERTLVMQRTTTYREQSRKFLAQAYEELAKGDLPQASEKGWGAASQMLKAIAQQRGWSHRSHHRELHGIIRQRSLRETGESGVDDSYSAMPATLHMQLSTRTCIKSRMYLEEPSCQQVVRLVDKAREALLEAQRPSPQGIAHPLLTARERW